MKNQYVGDVNDFFKYSILEIIDKILNKKIFVVWMLTKCEGMDIEYSKYKNKNPSLYLKLQKIITSNKRNVNSIESIYENYSYYSVLLEKRKRNEYFNNVEKKAESSDIVFFDPDNGISFNNAKSIKHLYWEEIKRFWNIGKDLLIYQHFQRKKWNDFIDELNGYIRKDLKGAILIPIKTKNVMFLPSSRMKWNKVNHVGG
jgi:hypothetical protein